MKTFKTEYFKAMLITMSDPFHITHCHIIHCKILIGTGLKAPIRSTDFDLKELKQTNKQKEIKNPPLRRWCSGNPPTDL